MDNVLKKLTRIEKYLDLHKSLAHLIEAEEKREARHNALVRDIIDIAEKRGISPEGLIPVDYGTHHLRGCPRGTNSKTKYDIGAQYSDEVSDYIRRIVMRHLIKCPLCHAIDAKEREA